MVKKKQIILTDIKDEDEDNLKIKQYKEADLILLFNLKRIVTYQTPLMKECRDVENPTFDIFEEHTFIADSTLYCNPKIDIKYDKT
jgi:hypothetical protein